MKILDMVERRVVLELFYPYNAKKYLMRAPELSPTAEKIDKLINRIDAGDIRIPAFQRAFVWKQNQILDLLDSVIKNYPIGSVLLWGTMEKLRHTRNIAGYRIPETSPEYPVNYVLDGQQRISSIYAVFSDKAEQESESEKYNPNLDIFEIYYDFVKKSFCTKNEVETTSNSVIYLRNFLDGAKLIDALELLHPNYRPDAKDLYSKFINYEVPVVTIRNRSKEEVGMIFERINNTGTKLSTLDLMTAWTWTDDFHLLEAIDELYEELSEKNFGDISKNILLQALSGVIQNDTTTNSIHNLSGEKVRDNWGNFCESLRKSIDFLSTELNCAHQDFLPYQQQLIAICKFFSVKGMPKAEEIKALKIWFWKTAFSNRYSTGNTTSKMNTDIENICEIRKGNASVLSTVKYTVSVGELISTKFSKANPLTRALLLLIAQHRPLDLVKNTSVDIGRALSQYNRKQFHHVFPNAFLKSKGFTQNIIFSIVNFCFLPADSNKKISKKSPSDYFFNLVPQDNLDRILLSNLLPVALHLYEDDDYIGFLTTRSSLIIEMLEKVTS